MDLLKRILSSRLITRAFISLWLAILSYLVTLFIINLSPRHAKLTWLSDFMPVAHNIGVVIAIATFWWYWKFSRRKR